MLRNVQKKVYGWQEKGIEGAAESDKVSQAVRVAETERRTIMLVDDEPMILESLGALLGRQFTVTVAGSGVEGLELLRGQKIDLIISDNRMPGMGGCEFLARVREISPSTVRFLMTGYPDLEIMDAIKKGVIARYLPKPWCNKGLKQAITEALEMQTLKELDKEGRLETRAQMARVLFQVENMKRRY